jgi:hypothetical protein
MERDLGLLPGEATIRKMVVFFNKNAAALFALVDKVLDSGFNSRRRRVTEILGAVRENK